MKEQRHGFWKVMYLKNGKQKGLCYGSMGNVCLRNCQRTSCIDIIGRLLILQRAQAKAHFCT
jgi:hypothetical protein